MSSRSNARRPALAPLALGAALAMAVGVGGGCAGDKNLSPEQRAETIKRDREAYGKLGFRHEWSGFPTMGSGARVKFFDVMGDVLTVQDSAGTVSIIETSSGATRWSDQLGTSLTKFVGNTRDLSTGRIVVCSESEAYYMDAETGTLLGKQRLDRVVNTRPLATGDLLVFGTASGEIFGQVKGQGFRAWGNSVNGSIETGGVTFPSGVIGFISRSGDIRFVDGGTGESVGHAKIWGGATVDPAASDSAMFIASTDQSIYAVSPAGGTIRWRKRTDVPLRYPPVYHDDRLYCAADGTGLMCLNTVDGAEVWVAKDVLGQVIGIRNGRLLVWDRNRVLTLDPRTGATIDRLSVNDIAFLRMDKFVDGNLYAATSRGVAAKFVPK